MFSHEKLTVYRKAIEFAAWTQPVLELLPGKVAAWDQLDRASTSIALNIAEGNVKFSIADRARFLQIAAGSTMESAACLDVLVARGLVGGDVAEQGKAQLETVAKMLMGLLDRLGYRFDATPAGGVREDAACYGGEMIAEG